MRKLRYSPNQFEISSVQSHAEAVMEIIYSIFQLNSLTPEFISPLVPFDTDNASINGQEYKVVSAQSTLSLMLMIKPTQQLYCSGTSQTFTGEINFYSFLEPPFAV